MRILTIILLLLFAFQIVSSENYPIVDTGQEKCFNNSNEISYPEKGNPFYGQDAQYQGNQTNYTDNEDGTITDNVTGLMWQKSPDYNGDGQINSHDKKTYYEALSDAETFSLAGYNDWRLPTIKELYSLFMAFGTDPSGPDAMDMFPYIDTDYFPFGYGDENNGERVIDAQYATSTIYVGEVFGGQQAMFGVNFADGRIKGYPIDSPNPNTEGMDFYVKYVRGNIDYGKNVFVDNNDGTISDKATGLMWTKNDSQEGMNWEDALSWVQERNNEDYLGYNDWRLPNVKELQSIIDYERSPTTTNSAAISPMFNCSQITDEDGNTNWPFFWSSTTHITASNQSPGRSAMYVCFGKALGYMEMPPNSGNVYLMDVHGAGAQRSDLKTGNPDDYPQGFGPQGDVVRIYNYVRMVRNDDGTSSIEDQSSLDHRINIFPNPAAEYIEIKVGNSHTHCLQDNIKIYNSFGECVLVEQTSLSVHKGKSDYDGDIFNVGEAFHNGQTGMFDLLRQTGNNHLSQTGMFDLLRIDISHLPAGLYFVQIGNYSEKLMVVR